MPKILQNAIQTPDGTILMSKSRWDYRDHLDRVTNNTYYVDGGREYLRQSSLPCTELNVFDTDSHDTVREKMIWGTRGVDGSEQVKYVFVKDLSDDHLESLVNYLITAGIPGRMMLGVIRDEQTYRRCYGISIPSGSY